LRTLNYQLKVLCEHNRDGSYGNKQKRLKSLQKIANDLHAMGYVHMNAHSLKRKHVLALVEKWQRNKLSPRSQANNLAFIRWWAKKVGRSHVMYRTNLEYGIRGTSLRSKQSKAWTMTPDQLKQITDPYIKLSLRIQQAFGLRREESLKFQATYADHTDYIDLKGSWTKGGRPRQVPLTSISQRPLLDEVAELTGDGSLIPSHLSYVQQVNRYVKAIDRAGMRNTHGLRHAYAQQRYLMLTGWPCPYQGGKSPDEMTPEEFEIDQTARLEVSHELGHGRVGITAVYIG